MSKLNQEGFVVRDSRAVDKPWVESPGYYTKNLVAAKTWVTRGHAEAHVTRQKPYNKFLIVKEITVTVK